MTQLNQIAIDIKMLKWSKQVQIPKMGGLKGWIICEYQGSLYIDVTTPPIEDAKNVIININSKLRYLLLNISMKYNLL